MLANIWMNILNKNYFGFLYSLLGKKMNIEVLPYWNTNDMCKCSDANFDSIFFNNFKTINNSGELV